MMISPDKRSEQRRRIDIFEQNLEQIIGRTRQNAVHLAFDNIPFAEIPDVEEAS